MGWGQHCWLRGWGCCAAVCMCVHVCSLFSPSVPQLRHFFVCDDLHFGVFALQHVPPGEEISLPFDFKYEKWLAHCALMVVLTLPLPRPHPSSFSSLAFAPLAVVQVFLSHCQWINSPSFLFLSFPFSPLSFCMSRLCQPYANISMTMILIFSSKFGSAMRSSFSILFQLSSYPSTRYNGCRSLAIILCPFLFVG